MLQNIKKTTFLMVILTMLCIWEMPSMVFAQTDQGTCGATSTWVYDSTSGTLTISGTGSVTNYSPFEGYKSSIKTIKINQGITKLEDYYGFENYKALTTVILPDSLTTINDFTFKGCTSLKSITIPKNVTEAGLAFYQSGLTSITFAEGMKAVPDYICNNCPKLQTINFASTIQSIERSAFEDCTSLTTVNLPASLTKIDSYAFKGCTGIKSITIPKNVTEAGLAFYKSGLTSIVFEKGIKEIPRYICNGCQYLQNVTIPDTVTKIGSSAFEDCTSLTSITIPASVTDIGFYAFEKSGLKTIYAPLGSYTEKYARENSFGFSSTGKSAPKKGSTHKVQNVNLKCKITNASTNGKGTVSVTGLIKKTSSVTIPKTVKINGYTYKVTAIEKKAFYKQTRLKKITIKSTTIKKIGSKAFTNIYKKATINVPKSKKAAYKKLLKKAGISKAIKIK